MEKTCNLSRVIFLLLFFFCFWATASNNSAKVIGPIDPKFTFKAELYKNQVVVRPDLLFVSLGGSEGGWQGAQMGAYHLAQRGFNAIALPYWGLTGLPDSMNKIELSFFAKVFTELRAKYPKSKIVVWGSSRGGELALRLAPFQWAQDATVSLAGSAIGMYGFDSLTQSTGPAWMYNGIPVPFLRPTTWPMEWINLGNHVWYYSDLKAYLLAIKGIGFNSVLVPRLELSKGPVLMFAAEDDQIWPSCALSKPGWDRLKLYNRPNNIYICLPRAGHDLGFPGVSDPQQRHFKLPDGTVINFGGDPKMVLENAKTIERTFNLWLEKF